MKREVGLDPLHLMVVKNPACASVTVAAGYYPLFARTPLAADEDAAAVLKLIAVLPQETQRVIVQKIAKAYLGFHSVDLGERPLGEQT